MSRNRSLWYRLPLLFTSGRLSIAVGILILLVAATPILLWWSLPHPSLVDWLTQQAWMGLRQDPYVQSLDPERQAAIPKRIADVLWSVYPKFAGLALIGGIVAAGAYLFVARLLRPILVAQDFPGATTPLASITPHHWVAPLLVAVMGFVAHVPYIEKSLNIDEASALQRLMTNGWYWADTRWGWQIHVGGLLLVQLSAVVFGYGSWAVRLPAALLSSAALGVLYAWVRSLHGSRVALLTTGFLALWPTWAEQCATARGYGLSFACGVLAVVALWRVLDEDRPHVLSVAKAIWLLFFAVLFGSLAHVFWMFLGLTCLVLLFWQAYFKRRAVAAAAAFFTGVALSLAGSVYAPGLPATLFQMNTVIRPSSSEMAGRFLQGFGFRVQWPVNVAITGGMAGLAALGLLLLARTERRRILMLLLVAVVVPLGLRPVYLYPRFFLHLGFLCYVPMFALGIFVDRLFQPRFALATVAVPLAAGVVWVQPWTQLPMVDLRSLAAYCQDRDASGDPCQVDASLHAAAIYPLGSQTRFVNLNRGITPAVQRLARCDSVLNPPPPLDGFRQVKVFPGWESNIRVFERTNDSK